jgi:hypothetical protein
VESVLLGDQRDARVVRWAQRSGVGMGELVIVAVLAMLAMIWSVRMFARTVR